MYKHDLEPPKELKKRYQRHSEEYEQLLARIPTFTKDTPMVSYSGFLKGYFTESQQFEQTRIDLLESYNLQLLRLNESLTGCLVGSLAAVKKQFNDHRQFISELEETCLFVDNCRLKKQQSHRALLLNSVNELRSSNKLTRDSDMEGYLFCKRQGGTFQRKYFSIENHRLFKIEQERHQLIKKEILPLELTNLKLSNLPYLNCFELESPGIRGSLVFLAETEYQLKEWCAAVKRNIELKISAAKFADPRSLKEDLKKIDKLIADTTCADCGGPNPSWISSTFLVMVCLECSGYHRKLGSLSKIRSLKLDVIEPELLRAIQEYGNKGINQILEGNIKESYKPNSNSNGIQKQNWIRQKYLERKYVDPSLISTCPELQAELITARKPSSEFPISEPSAAMQGSEPSSNDT